MSAPRPAPRRVSVVLPAYNVAGLVGRTVASLAAQGWPDLEIVAVDDGSTDGTGAALEAALAGFRRSGPARAARLIRQPNGGLGAARNAALDRVAGELVLFADGDDLLEPGAVAALVAALDAHPGAAIAFPRCRYVDEDERPLGFVSPRRDRPLSAEDLLGENPIHTDTGVLVPRAAIERAGRFDPALPSSIGLEFWMRVAAGRGACIVQVPEALVSYRRRGGQITADWRRQRRGWEATRARGLEAGLLDARALRRARGRTMLVWAANAQLAGERGAMWRLTLGALRRNPRAVLGTADGHARLAMLVVAALPPRWQAGLARAHKRWARRRAAGSGDAEFRR